MLTYKQKIVKVTEAYKDMIINILSNPENEMIKIIEIVSSNYKEGKTKISTGLSIVLSKNKKKVLLIDCNLRKPKCHKVFKMTNDYGLLDVLLDEKKYEEVVKKYYDNLDILLTGQVDNRQIDVIESKKMDELLEILKEKYDYIILDTPSINFYTDAQILSQKSDGVILAVNSKKVDLEELKTVKKKIEIVNANILGIVLNE
jgi:capsular exopolysaccharide synthesis family protein